MCRTLGILIAWSSVYECKQCGRGLLNQNISLEKPLILLKVGHCKARSV